MRNDARHWHACEKQGQCPRCQGLLRVDRTWVEDAWLWEWVCIGCGRRHPRGVLERLYQEPEVRPVSPRLPRRKGQGRRNTHE